VRRRVRYGSKEDNEGVKVDVEVEVEVRIRRR
jgi:hypothetical protein